MRMQHVPNEARFSSGILMAAADALIAA